MFTPNQHEVRQFFCAAYSLVHDVPRAREGVAPIQAIAMEWVREHPEYAADLVDVEKALTRDYREGASNPFLHLSMHVSITEQCSIDQPTGIRAAVEALLEKTDDLHETHHRVMEALGEMIWHSQRSGCAPDGVQYVEKVLAMSR